MTSRQLVPVVSQSSQSLNITFKHNSKFLGCKTGKDGRCNSSKIILRGDGLLRKLFIAKGILPEIKSKPHNSCVKLGVPLSELPTSISSNKRDLEFMSVSSSFKSCNDDDRQVANPSFKRLITDSPESLPSGFDSSNSGTSGIRATSFSTKYKVTTWISLLYG